MRSAVGFSLGRIFILSLAVLFAAGAVSAQPMPSCYHTRAAIDTFMQALLEADSVYHIVHIDTIGYSRGDMLQAWYPIYCVKVSDNPDVFEDEPTVLIIGHIHGEEMQGLELVLEYLWRLVTRYGLYSDLIESTQLYVVPTMNPDGLEVISRGLDNTWRKNGYVPPELNGRPCTIVPGIGRDSCGVDLNRNFGLNWIYGDTLWEWGPGVPEPYDYYRGPAVFSEPESRAVRDLAEQIKPTVSVVFHSSNQGGNSERGFVPWKWGPDPGPYKYPPDNAALGTFNSLYCSQYYGTIPDGGGHFMPTFGGTRNGCVHDWFYWKLGTIQILTELGPYGATQPVYDSLRSLINNSYLPALNWLCRRPMNLGRNGPTPLVIYTRDAFTLQPISAEWRLTNTYNALLQPWYTNQQYGAATTLLATPGLATIMARKDGYQTATVCTTVNPTSFPRVVTLDLQPLPYHAVQFSLHNLSGAPISGSIYADNGFQHWIDTPSGIAVIQLPEGHYSLMAVPDDPSLMVLFREVDVLGDAAVGFRLEPATLLWQEDLENGLSLWNASGNANPWRLEQDTTTMNFGQSLCFSPPGRREQYANDLDIYFTSVTPVALSAGNSAYLEFFRRGRLDVPADSLLIEISTDGGGTWEQAGGYSDLDLPWTRTLVNLTRWASQTIRLRLRFKSDHALGDLGLRLDGFRIRGGNDSASPEPPPSIVYSYRITGAYPNPFNSATTITYEVAAAGRVRLVVYNLLGEEVRRFDVHPSSAGPQTLIWDGTANGRDLASGLYFVQLQAPQSQSVRKLLLLR
ncbi:MAG: M14 family zinc carboxypeptidase [bacterium]|nr:M14 family zinc carboxypeptidase [bacterium]